MLQDFLSLIRFSHTVFALPFAGLAACWALVVPAEHFSLTTGQAVARIVGVIACMVFGRSAAMAFNRLVDQGFDGRNPRTMDRHLPAGILSRHQVWSFFLLSSFGFLAGTLLFWPNFLPLLLAVPVMLWICGYSYSKRFTTAAHLWLGAALALSPVCAWIAIRGEEVAAHWGDIWPSVLLGWAVMLWVAGFDIIYSCQDAEVDRELGLRSLPSRWGIQNALKLSAGLHGLMWFSLMAIPLLAPQLGLGGLYFAALIMVAVLLVRQHWIVEASDLSRVNEAFFSLNALISLGLTSVAAVDSLFSVAW